jgi:hypothetical protein
MQNTSTKIHNTDVLHYTIQRVTLWVALGGTMLSVYVPVTFRKYFVEIANVSLYQNMQR